MNNENLEYFIERSRKTENLLKRKRKNAKGVDIDDSSTNTKSKN